MAAVPPSNTLTFRRPHSSSNKEPSIFPPAIYTNATYSRGILVPNTNNNATVVDGNNIEEVSVSIPADYFQSSTHSLPSLTSSEAVTWNHGIAAHAASRRRPPMEIGRLLGTITLHFRDGTKKKSQSLYHLANRYFEKWGVQMRKPSKKEGEKHKTLTLKQALREACLETGLEEDAIIESLPATTQSQLNSRAQQIFDYWRKVRDLPPLHECWHKRDGGFIPKSLGDVVSNKDEFYVPVVLLLQWLDNDSVVDLASGRVKSLYGGLRHVKTDSRSVLESLMDLSCPGSLYKIPLVTPYAVASRSTTQNNEVTWKIRIGVYMNRLLLEVLTEKNLHCVMSALDEKSYIISEPLHLPPMRSLDDPVFASAKYPIVQMPNVEDANYDAMDEDKKEDDHIIDLTMVGSTRETETISPFTPRGLLKLLENTGNVTSEFPEISKSLSPYLKLDLMLHQQHAVCWMRQMEQLPGFGINSMIWEEREFLDGNKYYYSPALGQIRLNKPPTTVGGCVADEMGLGKTIQMLSLIACSMEELKAEAIAGKNKSSTHATLIVVPPALVSQWVAEVKKCCGNTLTVDVLDVNDTKFQTHHLVKARGAGNDILVTTYSALDNTKTSRYLASWNWGRIVLDEQQEIRSSTTKIAKNCESLNCHRRWMLSGTPIFEGIEDLRGELNFLRLTPYAAQWEDGFFDFSIMNHWKHHSEHCIETLRILGLLILRRSKDMTICHNGLPIMNQKKLTVELVPVAQSESERALYYWLEFLVSQEVARKDGESSNAKQNLQARDLCLRLLREVCFSAVLINGGIGAASQMRSLNTMYRKLLLRSETKNNSERKRKKPGAIRMMSPPKALTYLSQHERDANVGQEFISEQQFGGGQGASSRTYAVDTIEAQIKKAQEHVDGATRKVARARNKRAKARWHLALELITTGSLCTDTKVMASVSSKILSLWKWRCTYKETCGWRPRASFIQQLQMIKRFPWAHPTALQLNNIPSQVTADEVSSSLLNSLKKEPKIQSKLVALRNGLSKAKKEEDKARLRAGISNTETLLQQAIASDKILQPPVVTMVKTSNVDRWMAYVQMTDESEEQFIRQAQSTTGIIIKSKEVVPHIQAVIDKATHKLKQAEAAYTVHPCAKNKQEKSAAEKDLDKARIGLTINFDSAGLVSNNGVVMSRATRNRGTVLKTKAALVEASAAAISLAEEILERELNRLRDNQATLDRLTIALEKKGDRPNYLSQKSAFDTLEAIRQMDFDHTFCPICQMPFGENAGDDPKSENPIVAMISCGHFFCIKCIERHTQEEISRYRALTCPCCRKGFHQIDDVVHIDHLATDHLEAAMKREEAKNKVLEASELLDTSDGVLEGELWKYLFLSIDIPSHVSDAPDRCYTALPQDVLAHFRAATGMKIDCSRGNVPTSWMSAKSKKSDDFCGMSSKVQALLNDLPLGERSVVFSSSKEGVLHLTAVIKACGIECFSLYTGATNSTSTESWGAIPLDELKAGPVLVIQAGAAASGLTLTAASKIFLMEPFNRQEEEAQAYARCHRYGQTRDVYVKVYYAPVSVESRLLRWRKRSADKFAAAKNGPNYVFSKLYEEGSVISETADGSAGEDETDDYSDEEQSSVTKEETAEVHEETLRTQFLLGLVDEHGNPVGDVTDLAQDHQNAADQSVSATKFILG